MSLGDTRRGVLRALADHLVSALVRVADPSGCWVASERAVGTDTHSPRR